jgi:hypothetical protein
LRIVGRVYGAPRLRRKRTTVEHVTNTTLALRSTPHGGGAGLVLLLSVTTSRNASPAELTGEVVESAAPADDPLQVPPDSQRILSG